jgi:flagellar protein FliS
MGTRGYAARYTEAQVGSADPRQLLLLLFDGGLRFLRLAREALVAENATRFATNLSRAQAVIGELLATLDHARGGAIAGNLARLYEFMLMHLTEGNAQRSVRHVDEVIRLFDTIAGAYREVLTRPAPPADPAAA